MGPVALLSPRESDPGSQAHARVIVAKDVAMSVFDAAVKAVDASSHIDRSGADAGAVEAMLALARKIDAWDVIVDWANEDASESDSRPKVPANDNTSLPSFLKYCEALGLTPATRRALVSEVRPAGDAVDELKARRVRKQSVG